LGESGVMSGAEPPVGGSEDLVLRGVRGEEGGGTRGVVGQELEDRGKAQIGVGRVNGEDARRLEVTRVESDRFSSKEMNGDGVSGEGVDGENIELLWRLVFERKPRIAQDNAKSTRSFAPVGGEI